MKPIKNNNRCDYPVKGQDNLVFLRLLVGSAPDRPLSAKINDVLVKQIIYIITLLNYTQGGFTVSLIYTKNAAFQSALDVLRPVILSF